MPDLPHVLSVEAVNSKGTGRKCVLKLKGAHNPNGQHTTQDLSEPPYNRGQKKHWPRESTKTTHEVQVHSYEDMMMTFHSVTISDMLNEIRDETYTTLQVQHTNPLVDGGLRVKVDTGAARNMHPP